MSSTWRPSWVVARPVPLLGTLFLAVALSACGSTSGPPSATPARAPTAAPTPTVTPHFAVTPRPAPTAEVFTSSRFGYSITMTSDWRLNEIPGHWTGYVVPNFMGDTGTDAYTDIVTRELMEIGYLQLAHGASLDDWATAEAPKATFSDCTVTAGPDPLEVAGQDARYMLEVCPGHMVLNVFLVRGGTGIFSHFVGDRGIVKAVQTKYLDFLDSLQFG